MERVPKHPAAATLVSYYWKCPRSGKFSALLRPMAETKQTRIEPTIQGPTLQVPVRVLSEAHA